jgi:gamma-glutamyltranspeptidase / glutathione hydrolase
MINSKIRRRWGALLLAGATLASCVNAKFKTNEPLRGFVIADEPRAAQVGRDMLQAGGSAADAVAAMALTMSATLPSRVGLAGGGVCLVFDAASKTTQTLDFLPRAASPGGAVAAPGLMRAMTALHARGGKLRWEKVAVAAEQEAYRGVEVSRALAADIKAAGGRPPFPMAEEGGRFIQTELGAVLSQTRRSGVGTFYGGTVGAALAQATGLSPQVVSETRPQWRDTIHTGFDYYELHFPIMPEGPSGVTMQAAWAAGEKAKPEGRIDAALSVLRQSAGGGSAVVGSSTAVTPPGAAVVAVDGKENAVACALTMGGLFGTGKTAAGTGMLTAKPVASMGFGMPLLFTNHIVGRTRFAAVGAAQGGDGPLAGPGVAMAVALSALLDGGKAPELIAARPADFPGRIAALTCQPAQENLLKICQTGTDPRVPSLAYVIETDPHE